jgi:hypothetical protein
VFQALRKACLATSAKHERGRTWVIRRFGPFFQRGPAGTDLKVTSMKPSHSILDHAFRYVPAAATSVSDTWVRFGWRPMSQEERMRRRREGAFVAVSMADNVMALHPSRLAHS